MQVIMTETRPASPNGINVQLFREGETYEVPDTLGKTLIENKWARPAPDAPDAKGEAPEEARREARKAKPAPKENK